MQELPNPRNIQWMVVALEDVHVVPDPPLEEGG